MAALGNRQIFTHERAGRVIAGISLLVTVALGCFHHPAWLLLTAATGANLLWSGLTDRCVVRSLLVRMGFPGERDVGRAEAMLETSAGRESAPVNRVARPIELLRN